MNDELVTSLRNCAELNSLSFYKRELMKQAADAIEELSRENESLGNSLCESVELVRKLSKPKWIPVTERLPMDRHLVLIRHYSDVGNRFYGLDVYDGVGWVISEHVTHWMQLPEPPEEE